MVFGSVLRMHLPINQGKLFTSTSNFNSRVEIHSLNIFLHFFLLFVKFNLFKLFKNYY